MLNFKKIFFELNAILVGILFGFIPIFVAILRDKGVSSTEQISVRLLISFSLGILILIYYLIKEKHKFLESYTFSVQKYYLLQGLMITAMAFTYISSVVVGTPAGEAALLDQIHPVVTFVLAIFLLNERPTTKKTLSLGFALIGVFILVRPWQLNSFFKYFFGDILALMSGTFYSFYIIIGRYFSKDSMRKKIDSKLSISWIFVWALITAFPIILILIQIHSFPAITEFKVNKVLQTEILIFILGLAIVGNIIPYLLLMVVSKFVESSKTSILVLSEPLSAVLFGVIILSEPFTFEYLVGGGLLILGIMNILRKSDYIISGEEIK